jgi:chromosome segregation ATPase
MVNLPIQIQWNNERIAKANERIVKANKSMVQANRVILEANKRITEANKRIAQAKAYLSAAIEQCKATYGEDDTAIALEALVETVGVSPMTRRQSLVPQPFAVLSAASAAFAPGADPQPSLE